jgi:hypothetical protein
MSSSLKQLIVNAIIKVSATDPAMSHEGGPTHEEARDSFIKLLLAELFPENSDMPSPKVKKVKAKKEAPEVVPVPLTADQIPLPASPGEKKKRGPMTEEAKAAMKAKRDATIAAKKSPTEVAAPVEEKPKKAPKAKKAAVPEDANLQKIDPTWRKHLKKAAGDKYTKEQEAGLLTFLNDMGKDAFNGKKAEDHVNAFLGEKPAKPADDMVDAELTVVEFNGKEYYVNPETKRVYEGQGEYDDDAETWTTMKPVGYAGMAAFADMDLDA